jgi:multiple sugar transport system substrate-binding protein
MRRITRRAAIGGLSALAAVGTVRRARAQRATLKMWTFLATQGTDPRAGALRGVVERFNQSQARFEVQVESINFARIDNSVIQATAAGQGPDILNVYTDQLAMHVAAGTVAPLDRYVAAAPAAWRDDFVMNLGSVSFGGRVMALPWETRVWLLWYRKDLVERAGGAPPRTLEELGQLAGRLASDQAMGFGFGASTGALAAGMIEAFVPLFWGAGGTLFEANGRTGVNGPAGVQTLAYFRDMVARYRGMRPTVVSMSVEDAFTAVRAGTIAMTVMGSFRVAAARNAAATGDNLQTAAIPGWTAERPTPARLAGQTMTIGANSRQQDGAWAFIEHYTSTASQLEFSRAGVMPSRVSTYAESAFAENPNAAELRRWTEYARTAGRMEPTPADFSKLSEELARATQRVIAQNADPKAALDAAAEAYNAQHR